MKPRREYLAKLSLSTDAQEILHRVATAYAITTGEALEKCLSVDPDPSVKLDIEEQRSTISIRCQDWVRGRLADATMTRSARAELLLLSSESVLLSNGSHGCKIKERTP